MSSARPTQPRLQPVQHFDHGLRADAFALAGGQFLFGHREVQPHVGAVQRVAGGQQLLGDLAAVGAVFQQLLEAAYLAFGTAQAVVAVLDRLQTRLGRSR